MKRLIVALGVGWGLIYVTNHLLLPRAPTESKVAVQSEETSTNRRINSWGPYLSDVKHPEPNNMAQTSLKSRQTQEPAASEAELMQLSSRDIIDHAEAVALEERTLRVARVDNPPTAAVRQHNGGQSSLQDLKPNSEAVALEERTLQAGNRPAGTTSIVHVENPPTPSRKPRSPVTAKARIAQATVDQDLSRRPGSAPQRRGVGLFMFAPPGF
jgi:hypothetical protein